jgi:hypothetical protein
LYQEKSGNPDEKESALSAGFFDPFRDLIFFRCAGLMKMYPDFLLLKDAALGTADFVLTFYRNPKYRNIFFYKIIEPFARPK